MNAAKGRGFALAALITLLVSFATTASSQPATVSALTPGTFSTSGGGDSLAPILSRDGRYILFSSSANNLTTNTNGMAFAPVYPAALNVYLYDRTNGTTTLVSVNTNGAGVGNGDSIAMAISTNGQFALFESAATNLVPNDTNGVNDVFVRDVVNGITTLVSVSTNGGVGNGVSYSSTMTADGRYVAFTSAASNLVAGDTNNLPDVFVRDLVGSNTVLVSVGAMYTNTTPSVPTTNLSESPDISDNGQYVAFYSTATNLVPGVMTTSEIYVRDLVNGFTVQASTNSLSVVQATYNTSNVISGDFTMSSDGQYVAYVAGAAGVGSAFRNGVLVRYHVLTGAMDIVNTNAEGTSVGNEGTDRTLDMSPDGNYIAFITNSSAQTPSEYLPDGVWVWNAISNTTTLVSADTNSGASLLPDYYWPQISADGRYVCFFSSMTNLTLDPTITGFHLYEYDSVSSNITLVDSRTNGSAPAYYPMSPAALSTNGQIIAFDSYDPDIVTNDANRAYDVFVRDINTNTVELISAISPSLPSLTPDGASLISAFSLSQNARFVAFTSEADDLVTNDTNQCRDVFVHDMLTGSNALVSVATNGYSGNSISSDCAISSNGLYVAFTSSASNLIAGDTNMARDVFVRNLQTGMTTLISVNTGGTGPGNADSYSPIMSPDGRYVVFHSKASNLAPGYSSTTYESLFCRDTQLQTTIALVTNTSLTLLDTAMSADGHYVAYGGSGLTSYVWNLQTRQHIYANSAAAVALALSSGATNLAYATTTQVFLVNIPANTNVSLGGFANTTHAGLQFSTNGQYLVFNSGGSGKTNQIVVFNTHTGQTNLISKAYGSSAGGNGPSDSAAISPDGRFVAYRSFATNIVPGVSTAVPQIYLYDQNSGDTTLLTSSVYGNFPGDNRGLIPVFSGDAQTVVLTSWSDDVISQNFNHAGNVYAFSLYNSNSAPALVISLSPPATVTWPAMEGMSYQVQFKNNLTDPMWQVLNGNVSIVGGQGYATDLSPAPTQRFYRVMAY